MTSKEAGTAVVLCFLARHPFGFWSCQISGSVERVGDVKSVGRYGYLQKRDRAQNCAVCFTSDRL